MSSNRTPLSLKIDVIRDLTPQVRELIVSVVDPEKSFNFKAGQFVMLHVPTSPKPTLRAYSIASSDQNSKGFRLLFKYVPQGVASEYVWKLEAGQILQTTGPFGRVFFAEPPTEQIVFLNTGTGLSQHLCYLESKAKNYPHVHFHLYFGVREEQDIYFQEELLALQKELPHFHFHYVLSRGSEAWKGKRGYVQNFLSEIDFKNRPTTFYLCGNGAMIKDTKALLEKENFDKARIFAEAFD